MNEKVDFRERVLKRVMPKGVDTKDLKVEVKVNKPYTVKVNILDRDNRVLFYGISECSPKDRWDTFIGTMLAIARLKINVNSCFVRMEKNEHKKIWTPKLGDVYYVPHMDIVTGQIYANKIVWTDGNLDFVRLSLGNVYKTEREARKALRRNILNGRHIAKEARKYA